MRSMWLAERPRDGGDGGGLAVEPALEPLGDAAAAIRFEIWSRLTAAAGQRSRTSSTNGARFSRAIAAPATPVKSGGDVATTTSARPASGATAVASAMYER